MPPSPPYLLSPSILSANFLHLEKEIQAVLQGGADWIHIDVMDGHFVPNLTMGIPIIQCIKQQFSIPLDVHLMISQPQKLLDAFLQAGSDILTFHLEAAQNPLEICQYIHKHHKKVGVALKPQTPLEPLFPLLNSVDMVLIMSVEPGFSGQPFLPHVLDKIQQLRQKWNGNIQVDGGINLQTASLAKKAGANVFVAASYLFSHPSPTEQTRKLKKLLQT
ncbi:MAG: ribulose-phosphate 3-epimerase [Planctomycetota bacterium]|nr:MAG: ribulose-phosphate 3-epimerase [Planctomycetota bacterium]